MKYEVITPPEYSETLGPEEVAMVEFYFSNQFLPMLECDPSGPSVGYIILRAITPQRLQERLGTIDSWELHEFIAATITGWTPMCWILEMDYGNGQPMYESIIYRMKDTQNTQNFQTWNFYTTEEGN